MPYKEPLFENLDLNTPEGVNKLKEIFDKRIETFSNKLGNYSDSNAYSEEDFSSDLMQFINNNKDQAAQVNQVFEEYMSDSWVAEKWANMVLNPVGIARTYQLSKQGKLEPPNPFKSHGGYEGSEATASQALFYLAFRNSQKVHENASDYKFSEPYKVLAEAYHDAHKMVTPEGQKALTQRSEILKTILYKQSTAKVAQKVQAAQPTTQANASAYQVKEVDYAKVPDSAKSGIFEDLIAKRLAHFEINKDIGETPADGSTLSQGDFEKSVAKYIRTEKDYEQLIKAFAKVSQGNTTFAAHWAAMVTSMSGGMRTVQATGQGYFEALDPQKTPDAYKAGGPTLENVLFHLNYRNPQKPLFASYPANFRPLAEAYNRIHAHTYGYNSSTSKIKGLMSALGTEKQQAKVAIVESLDNSFDAVQRKLKEAKRTLGNLADKGAEALAAAKQKIKQELETKVSAMYETMKTLPEHLKAKWAEKINKLEGDIAQLVVGTMNDPTQNVISTKVASADAGPTVTPDAQTPTPAGQTAAEDQQADAGANVQPEADENLQSDESPAQSPTATYRASVDRSRSQTDLTTSGEEQDDKSRPATP